MRDEESKACAICHYAGASFSTAEGDVSHLPLATSQSKMKPLLKDK